jgi:V8-like Glu-specific endopeptidase
MVIIMKNKNIKLKFISMFISLTLIVVSILSLNSSINVNASSNQLGYCVYDPSVSSSYLSYTRHYTLNSLSYPTTTSSTRSIIGTDDRVIDYTKTGVVKIILQGGSFGTGFVVGKNTIATAGHCVFNISSSTTNVNNKSRVISRILLFDSNGKNVQTVEPKEIHVPARYILSKYDDTDNHVFDYALITVDDDLSDYCVFNLGTVTSDFDDGTHSVSITGFPNTINDDTVVNNTTKHNMYTGTGVCFSLDEDDELSYFDDMLKYNADTSAGDSGAPIYVTKKFNNEIYYTVVGIHIRGGNYGVKLTPNHLQFYISNQNL